MLNESTWINNGWFFLNLLFILIFEKRVFFWYGPAIKKQITPESRIRDVCVICFFSVYQTQETHFEKTASRKKTGSRIRDVRVIRFFTINQQK